MFTRVPACALGASVLVAVSAPLFAQGTAADYARAEGLNRRFQGLVVNVAERPTWLDVRTPVPG